MKYVKTYEGFLSKIRNIINHKDIEPKKIDFKEIVYTLEDCFLDLKDNGFSISIEHYPSNMYRSTNGEITFGKKREVFSISIRGPHERFEMTDDFDFDDPITNDWQNYFKMSEFKFKEIRDAILFASGLIKDQFGINMDIEYIDKIKDNDSFNEFNIVFDV